MIRMVKRPQEFAAFEADPGAKVAVLYGGEQAFSSGAVLGRLPDLRQDDRSARPGA